MEGIVEACIRGFRFALIIISYPHTQTIRLRLIVSTKIAPVCVCTDVYCVLRGDASRGKVTKEPRSSYVHVRTCLDCGEWDCEQVVVFASVDQSQI